MKLPNDPIETLGKDDAEFWCDEQNRMEHLFVTAIRHIRELRSGKTGPTIDGTMLLPWINATKRRMQYRCPACSISFYGYADMNLFCADCSVKLVAEPETVWPIASRLKIFRKENQDKLFGDTRSICVECAVCSEQFVPSRSDHRYCSDACRQKAHRRRLAMMDNHD